LVKILVFVEGVSLLIGSKSFLGTAFLNFSLLFFPLSLFIVISPVASSLGGVVLAGWREGRGNFLRGPRGRALPHEFLGWVFSLVAEADHGGGRSIAE
jgi:hypothetical protein